MASSRLTRRRQGSVPKSDSPDNGNGNVDENGENVKNNNVVASAAAAAAKRGNDFRLEDLEMVKTIGTGTFARVYLCRHRRTDYYALKVWIEKLKKMKNSRFFYRSKWDSTKVYITIKRFKICISVTKGNKRNIYSAAKNFFVLKRPLN